MRQRWIARSAGVTLALAASGGLLHAAQAGDQVDLALVLAVDVSRSMDYDEQQLQRQGYVNAIKHPDVVSAIADGSTGKIAITYVEWAGPLYQNIVAPWTVIGSQQDADAFAARIDAAPILHETGTSISSGLFFSSELFAQSGVDPMRRTIDVSGDGPNNMGMPVVPMRDNIVSQGITINGLPIVLKRPSGYSPFDIPNLDAYYKDCVIGGPEAFVIAVRDMQGFEEAVRRKLVLEISQAQPRVIAAADTVTVPDQPVDCLIGEKARGSWFLDEPGQH